MVYAAILSLIFRNTTMTSVEAAAALMHKETGMDRPQMVEAGPIGRGAAG